MLKKDKELKKWQNYHGEDEVITSFDMLDLLSKQPKEKILMSKLPFLDKLINGFETGELVIISGERKNGKTLLAQTLTYSFLEQDIRSLWFSFELTPRQFLRCFPAPIPLFCMPKKLKPFALSWIKQRVEEAIEKYKIQVVFIDHLHFLFDLALRQNASISIGQVIRFLKTMAIELQIVVFLICHMQKIDKGKEPSDRDYRDSSFIGQESDTGLIIWRCPKQGENYAKLKVAYSRRTGALEKKIKLIKTGGFLREVSDEM